MGVIITPGGSGGTGPAGPPGPAGANGGTYVPVFITTNYTAHEGEAVLCITTGGNVPVLLPTPVTATNSIVVKKITTDGNAVVVSTATGLIEGVTGLQSSIEWGDRNVSLTFLPDGTNWRII